MKNILLGKVAIVTGATSGIGKATAELLLSKGVKVYGIARNVVNDLPFTSFVGDITDSQTINNIFLEVQAKEKHIDILVNCAGMGIAGAIEFTTDEELEKQFGVNLIGTIKMCRVAIPFLRDAGGGNIINIGSVAGEVPIPFQACYSASKAGLENFSMAFGLEVKDFNIKVTTILPGDTKTGFTNARIKTQTELNKEYGERIKKSIEKMENDEKNGKPPSSVANVVLNVLTKKYPPVIKTVGGSYKLIVGLTKILPKKFMLKIIKKIYG